jgi:hypothetical protein
MDGLPAWPALVFVRLELGTIFWFVEDKCFAVGTDGFLFPGFLGPVCVCRGAYVPSGGVLSLSSCWVGVRLLPPLPATSAFILSTIAFMLASFVAAIAAICLSCCSCSIANNIACDSPSSSAAAVSLARIPASLRRDCFAVMAEYCLRSSHLLVKYVWSAAHVCCSAVLFSHASVWSSVNILLFHICAPAAIVFSSSLVAIPRSPSDTWKRSSYVKYAVMLVVGSHGLLYPIVLYSCFCAVVIFIAVLR